MTELSTIAADTAERYFIRYQYPGWLQAHSRLVGRVAALLAIASAQAGATIDIAAVSLAGHLHDIGKSPLLAGDPRRHEALSALVLAAEGLPELVEPARRHPLYAPLDPTLAPRTLAERIVYLADRRAGLAVVSLEERIAAQAARHPGFAAQRPAELAAARAIEAAVFAPLPFGPDALAARLAASDAAAARRRAAPTERDRTTAGATAGTTAGAAG